MKRRWHYWRWILRTNRLLLVGLVLFFILLGLIQWNGSSIRTLLQTIYEEYGVWAVEIMMGVWKPGEASEEDVWKTLVVKQPELFSYLEDQPESVEYGEDPAYERSLASVWERKVLEENEEALSGNMEMGNRWTIEEAIAMKPEGNNVLKEKLADYDYVMKHFYSVHPTTTAGRDMIQAEEFLSMDFAIEKQPEQPQILIYHTHSQEEFADFAENPEATIVGVGAYLAELLEAQGYHVIHDTTIYDMKNGKLDRSQAYTYALDGITGILQEYPSIEVVLDVHRDGVDEGTHLVTEINGKPTAQIMFFNGTSQTPEGPIEYLQNPNRQANLAFSFQMQMAAKELFPGFTRKIYLKGLRYNQHVRARTALIEVGAQTNTYAEALNAMEPLAELLYEVLDG